MIKRFYIMLFLTIIFSATLPGQKVWALDPGLSSWEAGKYPQALEYYKQKLETTPDDPVLNFNAGVNAQKSEDYESAKNYYQRAYRSRDTHLLSDSYYNMGQIKLKEQDTKGALEDFQKSIVLNPGSLDAKAMYEMTRKILEEQQEQKQQDQDKQENQDNRDEQQDQQNKNSENNKEKEENKDREQQEDKESKSQPQSQDSQSQSAQMKESEENMDQEQVDNILNAMRERELESMKKLIKEQHKTAKIKRRKDW